MRNTFLFAMLALVATTILGCGGVEKPADLPELYPCKISVIQDGQPLEGATVILADATSQLRFSVGGVTNAQGVVEVKTDGKFQGAPQGKYKVLISKVFVPEMIQEAPPEDPDAKAEYDKKLQELNAQQADTVDVNYKKFGTTPAEIEVTPSGAEASFDVGPKVKVSNGSGGKT